MGGYAHLDEGAAERLRLTSGLSLLGEIPDSGAAAARFAVRRGNGEVVRLSRLPYLVTVAIAEATMASGALGRGVSADLVASEVSAQAGQEVTAAGVRSLVVGHLAPLGIVMSGPTGPVPVVPATDQPAAPAVDQPAVDQPAVDQPAAPATDQPAAPAADQPTVPGTDQPVGPVTDQLAVAAADQGSAGRRPRRRTAALAGLGLLVVAAGVTVGVVVVTRPGPAPKPTPTAAANQVRAAAWVAGQVSPGTMVSCDPATCGQLRRDGFPAARLVTLEPGTQNPLGSAVVVATPAVRSEFGAQLASVYAPLVIAGFGSGANRVEVRTIAPNGPATFESELKAQQASLRSAGQELLRNRTVQAAPAARADLMAGRVDGRLLANLSVLSSQLTIKLVAFDDVAPGASSAVPMRSVQLSATSARDRAAILDFLHAQKGAYRADVVTATDGSGGQPMVTVRFDAPGPMPAP